MRGICCVLFWPSGRDRRNEAVCALAQPYGCVAANQSEVTGALSRLAPRTFDQPFSFSRNSAKAIRDLCMLLTCAMQTGCVKIISRPEEYSGVIYGPITRATATEHQLSMVYQICCSTPRRRQPLSHTTKMTLRKASSSLLKAISRQGCSCSAVRPTLSQVRDHDQRQSRSCFIKASPSLSKICEGMI
jgi:hypothetical protein